MTTILLSFLAVVGAFVVTEMVVRAWLARWGRSYSLQPFSRIRLHIDRDTLPSLEPVVEHRINSEGERGDEPPPDKEGLFRVLVVGGSAAECWLIDQKTSWPNVVQEILRGPQNLAKLGAKSVHIGNLGRSLVTCRHIDEILHRVLPHYEHLDAIIFMVGASDIVHWLEKGAPSVFDEIRICPGSIFGQYPDGPFGWGLRSLALRRIVARARRRWGSSFDVRQRVGKRVGEARLMRQEATTVIDQLPDPKSMLQYFDKWFSSLIVRARQKTENIVVVRQPWLEKEFSSEEEKLLWSYGAGRPYDGKVTTYYSHKVAWQLHRLIDQHTVAVANSLGVRTLNLALDLQASFKHYYDDLHFTPEGCRVIGEAVAKAIVDAAVTKRTH